MLNIQKVHHVAVICSDYQKSKDFYTRILGMHMIAEHYRTDRDSWKLDLALNDQYIIELFSFPSPPPRPSRPEAAGLRHLAFESDDIIGAVQWLNSNGIETEPVRTDEYTGKRFTFFKDPDDLPLELYQK